MQTRTVTIQFKVPVVTATLRSSAMAIAGAVVVGGISVLAMVRALVDEDAYPSSGAAGVASIAAAAIFIGVLRWVPALSEEIARPVPVRDAAVLFGAACGMGAVALLRPSWGDVLLGPLTTLCVVSAYLSCWGYRSLFLLRRVVVFSVLTWPPLASGLYIATDRLLAGASELTYERLGSLGIGDATEHPWRVLSAFGYPATVAVIGAIALSLAASRLRLSPSSAARLGVAAAAAMVIHHLLVLTAPIESYHPGWWARLVGGRVFDMAIGADVAMAMFYTCWRLTNSEQAETAPADRDPQIFGAGTARVPVPAVRFCSVIFPAALLAYAVVRR